MRLRDRVLRKVGRLISVGRLTLGEFHLLEFRHLVGDLAQQVFDAVQPRPALVVGGHDVKPTPSISAASR